MDINYDKAIRSVTKTLCEFGMGNRQAEDRARQIAQIAAMGDNINPITVFELLTPTGIIEGVADDARPHLVYEVTRVWHAETSSRFAATVSLLETGMSEASASKWMAKKGY